MTYNPSIQPTPQQIKTARTAAGLTQTQAGQLVHAGLRSWQYWERPDKPRPMPLASWHLFLILVGAI